MATNKLQWKRIAMGDKLPCQSFLRKKNGEILKLSTVAGVTVGQDAYYLPVDDVIEEIRNYPIEESEDERIRKKIIKLVKEHSVNHEKCQMEAWLEKQGEKKPILDIEIPFGAKDSELEDVTYDIPKGYHAEIEDNKVVIKKGEQKPVEWSEYDEEFLLELSQCCELNKTQVQWLLSLKDRVQSQQRQEYDDMAYEMSKAVLYDKLKGSLRPQSTWKPSDEQIKAIQEAIGIVGQLTPRGECLKELLEQLKKLMEE